MHTLRHLFTAASLASVLLLAASSVGMAASERLGPAKVSDGIKLTELADPMYLSGSPACGPAAGAASVASFSPDMKQFVVVLRRGEVRQNVNEYTMLLWRISNIAGGPIPILRMRSSSILPAIDPSSISWSPTGDALTFLGERRGERHELMKLNINTGGVRVVTRSPMDVVSYGRSAAGNVVAYEALARPENLWNHVTARSGLVVGSEWPQDIIMGVNSHIGSGGGLAARKLFIKSQVGIRRIQALRGSVFYGDSEGRNAHELSVSPDGRHVIVIERVPTVEVPAVWYKYRDPLVRLALAYPLQGTYGRWKESGVSRYILVNTRTGRSRVLLNVPVVVPNRVVWAPNGRSVVVSQTLLPIDSKAPERDGGESSERKTLEVDINTGRIRMFENTCHQAIGWIENTVTCDTQAAKTVGMLKSLENPARMAVQDPARDACRATELAPFRRAGARWKQRGAAKPLEIDVLLKENMNTPPKLYYRVQGGRDRLLWDLNPQLSRVRLAKEKTVAWVLPNGERITAGLYYPPGYEAGRLYPLVVQTHGFNPDRFEFFGPYSTAFAAQPLAARGIFVLQVQDIYLPEGVKSVENAMKLYKSAIQYLSQSGLIDARRIGIVGFSYTSFLVKWALTHDPKVFAAAVIAEGGDGGYLAYMTGWRDVDVDAIYGGPPFGSHLKTWLELSPGFNLDRVDAPVLLVEQMPAAISLEWEWFAGLTQLKKPVEMVALDHDAHMLQKPWDRLVSGSKTVDWFDFWLNDREDDVAAKSAQYARWRRLRKLWGAEQRAGTVVLRHAAGAKLRSQGNP